MSAKVLERQVAEYPECPECGSQDLHKNGWSRAGKRGWRCKECYRSFVVDPYIPGEIKIIADRLLTLGMSVSSAAEVLNGFVSKRWLYNRRKFLTGEMNG